MSDVVAPVYLDYAASTPVDPRVAEAWWDTARSAKCAGNPSAAHSSGRRGMAVVERAQQQLAALLNCAARDLIWTSGATESDNLAIIGAASYRADRGRHLVTMRTEHRAVTDAFTALERRGFDVTWITPEHNGQLDIARFEAALRDDTQLVSIMHVNNETGVVQDIARIGRICCERDILYHCDAAQSVGKLPIDLAELPVDLMSMTAHKLYGPAGIGALYVADRPGCRVEPLLYGGGQQRALRPGTLPSALIAAFGEAAEIAAEEMSSNLAHLEALRRRLWAAIADVPGIVLNGDLDDGFPGILNVSVADIEGESLLLALEPLCVATGSACSSTDRDPSYVLRALGRDDALAQSAIRFSFGKPTTTAEIDFAAAAYRRAVGFLTGLSPGAAA